MKVYLIGALKNPAIPHLAVELRTTGHDIFEDWYSAGPEADVKWREHELVRGRSFREALQGHHAQNAFAFDKKHLDEADVAVLVAPAGKSAHLELGYVIGQGKPGIILLEPETDRFDLMYLLASHLVEGVGELKALLETLAPGFVESPYLPWGRD